MVVWSRALQRYVYAGINNVHILAEVKPSRGAREFSIFPFGYMRRAHLYDYIYIVLHLYLHLLFGIYMVEAARDERKT